MAKTMANDAGQMAAWIVANKDKKGTTEFEKVATAFKVLAAGGVDQYAENRVGPAKPQPNPMTFNSEGGLRTPTEKFRIGIGSGMNDLVRGAGQALGKIPQEQIDALQERDAPIAQSGLGAAGKAVGTTAMLAPLAAIPGAGSYTGSAMAGALAGGLQPTRTGESAAYNATQGALAGVGGRALTGSTAGALNPQTSQRAQALMNSGVRLPPGQMLGGAARRMEEGAESLPILGDAIKNSKVRAFEDWNNTMLNTVLRPLGQTIQGHGHDAVRRVYTIVSDAYDDVLSKLPLKLDQQAVAKLTNVRNMVQGGLAPKQQARFEQVMDDLAVSKLSPVGGMTGQSFKGLMSVLRDRASRFSRSQDPEDHLLGDAFSEVHSQLRKMAARQNPRQAAQLAKADAAYTNLLRVERAAGAAGSREGVFSPAGLEGAARAMDQSLRKRATAHGRAPMQRQAEMARDVMGPTLPDSGTPYRIVNMLMGGGALANPGMVLPAAGALTAASAPYAAAANPAVRALLTQRPQAARQLGQQVQKLNPLAAALAAPHAAKDRR